MDSMYKDPLPSATTASLRVAQLVVCDKPFVADFDMHFGAVADLYLRLLG